MKPRDDFPIPSMPSRTNSPAYHMLEAHDEEDEVDLAPHPVSIPKLPKGKKLLDTTVAEDVDSLYRHVFDNDTFFEIVGSKAYEEFKNYSCEPWVASRTDGLLERTMKYEISKNIAFSRQNVSVEQTQVQLGYSRRGLVYGVDTVTQNSGVVYSDYFRLNIHYRFERDEDKPLSHSRLAVVADIEFVKPCLFRGRIESEAWSGLKKYYEIVEKEVQLEKSYVYDEQDAAPAVVGHPEYFAEHDNTKAKWVKESLNRRLHHHGSNHSLPRSTVSAHSPELVTVAPARLGGVSQEVIMLAFLLVILTLLMVTLALFKLNGAMTLMDERLNRIEELLERNSKIFDLILRLDPGDTMAKSSDQ